MIQPPPFTTQPILLLVSRAGSLVLRMSTIESVASPAADVVGEPPPHEHQNQLQLAQSMAAPVPSGVLQNFTTQAAPRRPSKPTTKRLLLIPDLYQQAKSSRQRRREKNKTAKPVVVAPHGMLPLQLPPPAVSLSGPRFQPPPAAASSSLVSNDLVDTYFPVAALRYRTVRNQKQVRVRLSSLLGAPAPSSPSYRCRVSGACGMARRLHQIERDRPRHRAGASQTQGRCAFCEICTKLGTMERPARHRHRREQPA